MKNSAITCPLYDQAPNGKLYFEELEKIVNSRQKLLNIVDYKKNQSTDPKSTIHNSLNEAEPFIGWQDKLNNDITSFFILMLAYCNNETHKNW